MFARSFLRLIRSHRVHIAMRDRVQVCFMRTHRYPPISSGQTTTPLSMCFCTDSSPTCQITSKLIDENSLVQCFHTKLLQSNLSELLKLAALEVQLGRWHRSSSTSDPEGPLPPIDRFLIEPLTRTLQLDAAPVLQLIYFVCGLSSEWLDSCAAVLQCNEPARIRLELLNPSRLLMDCLDPLAHVGIRNPQKLLTRCPDLILACAVPPPQLSLNKDDTGSKKSEHRRETALTSALDEIGSLIARNDLVSLINRFPAVLLRPPNELAEMYTYLTEEMGLQSTEIIRFAKTPNHRHSLRHISGLRLVACPAWCLPIEHVRARHSLSLLAGCWPPKNSIDETKVSPDEKLAALLTCSPGEFWSWLRRSPGKVSGTNQSVSELERAVAFKADDVKIFEHMISRVVHDTEKSTDDDSYIQVSRFCLDQDNDVDNDFSEPFGHTLDVSSNTRN